MFYSAVWLLTWLHALGTRPGLAPPAIAPAYLTEVGVTFESPEPVNWDSLAPKTLSLTALEADSVHRRELYRQRTDYGTTEVSFVLPLPTALQTRHYVLADSIGVLPFAPTELVGTVRIQWSDSGATIAGITTFGCLRGVLPVGRGRGFVFSAPEPLELRIAPSSRTPDQLLAPNGEAYPYRGTAFWTVLWQYQLVSAAPGSDRWIWVQWQPDSENVEAGCTYRFSLFRAGPLISALASADDGCDV